MNTPFRFLDDTKRIIPRRRFGQPPTAQGRQHGAVVLTGLPTVEDDEGPGFQNITEPEEKTTSRSVEFARVPPIPVETAVQEERAAPETLLTTAPLETPLETPLEAPGEKTDSKGPVPELVQLVNSLETRSHRRFDAKHTRASVAEGVATERFNAAKGTAARPKAENPARRWMSVLVTTLAIVGVLLFLAGLFSGSRPSAPEAPMSDWKVDPSPAVVVTGTIEGSTHQNSASRLEPSLDSSAKLASPLVNNDDRVVESPSLSRPEPTLATIETPVDRAVTVDPGTQSLGPLAVERSVLSGTSTPAQGNLAGRMSLPADASDRGLQGTRTQQKREVVDAAVYPTTDPSTYRTPLTETLPKATPQHPGTARLDGSIHNYRRPR